MKYFLLPFLALLLLVDTNSIAQCGLNESEIEFSTGCSAGNCNVFINISSTDGLTIYYSASTQESTTQQICLPIGECVIFYMQYQGSILPDDMNITISENGEELINQYISTYTQSFFLNCGEGANCQTPISIVEGTYTANFDDTWYEYTADETGTLQITTCGMNSCDTKIWVYLVCPNAPNDGPPGTYAYNDDGPCGVLSSLNVAVNAGATYIIRIGDYNNSCSGPVQFSINMEGPLLGCTDETACNYNPAATVLDNSCVYFPSPLCSQPDLVMNVETLISTMYSMQTQSTPCNIEEGIVTGDGMRDVITFSVRIDNVGQADYYIGDPSNNPEMFDVQNCHGHTHYAGYGDYRLMDMEGNIIPAGHKNGFCVMDLCGFGQYNCGQMGISAGCYDEYGAGTSGQWFDITDVPDGNYYGLVTVNPLHLPDAMNRQELDYENNTYTFCLELTTSNQGQRGFLLLGDGACTPFVDCLGVTNGTAHQDCNGDCNGPAIWGDVQVDNELNNQDISQYLSILAQDEMVVTTCNDLSGNGSLTIYDLVLGNVCETESQTGGTTSCDFPHNVLSTNGACGMAITEVNFTEGYIDVELKTIAYDIIGYQFTIGGVVLENVENLAGTNGFDCSIGFNPFTNSIFAMGEYGDQLDNQNAAHMVCRIYYSQITSNTICIEGITDIVSSQRTRIPSYVYENCFDATAFSVLENQLIPSLVVSPNPAVNALNIQLNRFTKQPKNLVIRDHVGRIVSTVNIQTQNGINGIDISTLSPGVYTLSCEEVGIYNATARFVKL